MTAPIVDDGELLAHEIEAHQFTEPLKTQPPPNLLVRAFVFATTQRVWFRVGWTCRCVVRLLTVVEKEMLLRGEIDRELDIYQLQGTAAASAGTHALYACYDIGQTSDAQIDTQRRAGGCAQRRTVAQGFSVEHCHGWPNDCPHGSPAQKAQQVQWDQGTNGLISRGPIIGRWPIKTWSVAVAEMEARIVALADDIANKVAAKVGTKNQIASAVWAAMFTGPDSKTKWTTSHILSWLGRMMINGATKAELAAARADLTAAKADLAAVKTQVAAIAAKLNQPPAAAGLPTDPTS